MCTINNVFMFQSVPPTNILKTPHFVDSEISKIFLCNFICRGSYINAHVLLNLLNELKRDKIQER